jgi:hypothetical protein
VAEASAPPGILPTFSKEIRKTPIFMSGFEMICSLPLWRDCEERLCAYCANVTRPERALVMLRSASIKFFTKDNEKHPDSALSVYVRVGDRQIVSVENYGGGIAFGDWEIHKAQLRVDLPSLSGPNVKRGISTQIRFSPAGDNTWRFWYLVSLDFSDAAAIEFERTGEDLELPIFPGHPVRISHVFLSEQRRDMTWHDLPRK